MRTVRHLLETGESIKCDFCKLFVQREKYESPLLSDSYITNRTRGSKINHIVVLLTNRKKSIYMTPLGTQTHIHIKTKNHLVQQGCNATPKDTQNTNLSLSGKTISNLINKYKSVPGHNTTINPFYFTSFNHFDNSCPPTLVTHTQDHKDGQPTKSTLSIKPLFDRIREYDINEITKQLTKIFLWLIEQPNLKIQIGSHCHL